MTEKPVWRFVAIVGDKKIMKQGEKREKVQKTIRNRLCDYAGIDYPFGWYNNEDEFEKNFLYRIVDSFIGEPQIVMNTEPIVNNVGAILVIPPSEIIKYFGSKEDDNTEMKPNEIDDEGNWHSPSGKMVPLLGSNIPIPDNARLDGHPEDQQVLMVMGVDNYFEICPSCGDELLPNNIMIVTEFAKMIPTRCCNTFVWIAGDEDSLKEHR